MNSPYSYQSQRPEISKMKYLFTHLNKVTKTITRAKKILILLDYDGTLTPIVDDPEQATIPANILNCLKLLSENNRAQLAIVSGRGLDDIKRRVPVPATIYSGNHGMQIEGPDLSYLHSIPNDYKNIILTIKDKLLHSFDELKGVFVEDKMVGLSVHYRQVDPDYSHEVKEQMAIYSQYKFIKIRHDQMTYDIMPDLSWDKGTAIRHILDHLHHASQQVWYPIYIGDGLTDEDAFSVIKEIGLPVRVGASEKSDAAFFINDFNEVGIFLQHLLKII